MASRSFSLKEVRRIGTNRGCTETPIIRTYRKCTPYLTYLALKTPITPNQITFVALMINFVALYFFTTGSYELQVWAAAMYLFAYILDYVDGEVARCRQNFTKIGPWLDMLSHDLVYPFTFLTIGIGLNERFDDPSFLIFGAVAGLFIIMRRMTETRFFHTHEKGKEEKESASTKKASKPKYIYNWKTALLEVTKFWILAPLLLVMSIFDILDLFVMFYVVYLGLIYAGTILMQYRKLAEIDLKNKKG